MNSSAKNRKSFRTTFIVTAILVFAILVVYDYLFYYEPIAEYWNQLTLDLLTAVVAGAVTIMGVLLTRQFDRGEAPRRVWIWFTLGWGAWFAGELVGTGYDVFKIYPMPDFGLYDVCWLAGYFCFGLSLYYQFQLIYSGEKRRKSLYYFAMVVITLLVALGLAQLALRAGLGEGINWIAVYLAVLYPVCDVVEGLAAIWLSLLFGRGRWGRPWWGLIVFAVADTIGILNWLGAFDSLPEKTRDYISLFSDTTYNIGYVVALLALLSLFLFFKQNANTADALPEK